MNSILWVLDRLLTINGFCQFCRGCWVLESPRFRDPVLPLPLFNWVSALGLIGCLAAALFFGNSWVIGFLPMAVIDWILWTEPATGRNHPILPDVDNRPLRQVLTDSGYDPDASFTGLP